MRVIFMGTPDFSVLALQKLAIEHEVVAVFTQVDKKRGRGKKVKYTAVKTAALALDLPVYQYANINSPESLDLISSLNADVIVVVAFGQILKKELLTITPYGCINIHASHLPRWRGASPIQTAIAAGDKSTAVTIMQMDKGLDTGDMLKIVEQEITEAMTGGELHDALAIKGAEAIVEVLADLEKGKLKPEKQDDNLSTYAPLITKEMAKINWNASAEEVVNLIRAYNPFPTTYTSYDGGRLKIYRASVFSTDNQAEVGKIVAVAKDYFVVQTGKGQIAVEEVQFVNRKRMTVGAYLLGNEIDTDIILG